MSNYLNTVKESRFSVSARAIVDTLNEVTNAKPTTITGMIKMWVSRFKQRRSLANLPDHLLKDIGISRDAALEEACKPFWQK